MMKGATRNIFKRLFITSISGWLIVFALLPLLIMLVISFLSHNNQQLIQPSFTLDNYRTLVDNIFVRIFFHSLWFASVVTALTLLIAYPAAYAISQSKPKTKPLLLMFMIIPFWTSSLIRTYGIMALIKVKGLLNTVLLALGLIHQPLQLLYSNSAVYIGMVYNLLPFMILPLYSNFEKLDHRIIEAARDLGASRSRILSQIIIPLSMPGIMAGVLFVFLPAMTLFYIPDLLGGAKGLLLGNLVEVQFLQMLNWPGGAATSIALTILLLTLLAIYKKRMKKMQFQELL